MFTPYVSERLKHYVYLLRDPRDGKTFYVGKGHDNRVFAHAQDALSEETGKTDKLDRIRQIHAAGGVVDSALLRFGLTEATAFEVESAVIQLLGLDTLDNQVAGHHIGERGLMTTDVAISLFDAPPAEEITVPSVLIRIPQLWSPAMPPEELFLATRGWWKINPRLHESRYAFSVNRGVIREVYQIDGWRPQQEGDHGWSPVLTEPPRWGFEGSIAPKMGHYRNRSVKHLLKRGMASPVLYLNC